jgi:hypothetical protein
MRWQRTDQEVLEDLEARQGLGGQFPLLGREGLEDRGRPLALE